MVIDGYGPRWIIEFGGHGFLRANHLMQPSNPSLPAKEYLNSAVQTHTVWFLFERNLDGQGGVTDGTRKGFSGKIGDFHNVTLLFSAQRCCSRSHWSNSRKNSRSSSSACGSISSFMMDG